MLQKIPYPGKVPLAVGNAVMAVQELVEVDAVPMRLEETWVGSDAIAQAEDEELFQ